MQNILRGVEQLQGVRKEAEIYRIPFILWACWKYS